MASPGSAVVAETNTLTVGTPGKISTTQDPINNKKNDIHLFKKGLITYRGDNSFEISKANSYQAQFFALKKEVAESQYGKLVLKFTLKKDLKLLRLDKNAEGFHHWLKTTKNVEEQDKTILYKNFGYPEQYSPTVSADKQLRSRFSQGDQDRKMLDMIKLYSDETGQQIDGYYNSAMANGALGSLNTENGGTPLFHAELAVFSSKEVFSQPDVVNSLDPDQVKMLNQEAKLIRYATEQRIEKQNKRRKTISGFTPVDSTTIPTTRKRSFSF